MEMMYSRYTKELRNTSCQNNRMILFNSAASENMSLDSICSDYCSNDKRFSCAKTNYIILMRRIQNFVPNKHVLLKKEIGNLKTAIK